MPNVYCITANAFSHGVVICVYLPLRCRLSDSAVSSTLSLTSRLGCHRIDSGPSHGSEVCISPGHYHYQAVPHRTEGKIRVGELSGLLRNTMRQIGHYVLTYIDTDYGLSTAANNNSQACQNNHLDHQIRNDGMHSGLGLGSVQSEEDW